MVQLVTDGTWSLSDLGSFVEPVEICDAEGKLLGLFVPANLERGQALHASTAEQFDWAEIERRRRSGGPEIPSAKVLGHLRALEVECERRQTAGERALTPDEAVAFVRTLRDQDEPTDSLAEKSGCATP